MTEHRPFIDAIIASPADDLPRLVYADFLEEQGQIPAAEFIRQQCVGEHLVVPMSLGSPAIESLFGRGWQTNCKCVTNKTGSYIYRGYHKNLQLVKYTRGFASEIRCALADWMTHGPTIVREHPIEQVEISDREPWGVGGRWYWNKVGSFHWASDLLIPQELCWWDDYLSPPYRTAESAHAALSEHLIKWTKAKATTLRGN